MDGPRNLSDRLRDTMARLPGGRRLRAERDRAERHRDSLEARVRHLEEAADDLRGRLEVHRRRAASTTPQAEVLADVLALRHAAWLRTPSERRRAVADIFASRCEAYRDQRRRVEERPVGVVPVALNGLTWWVPSTEDGTGGVAERLLGKERLPLDEILETRELAVGDTMIDIGANIGTTSIPRVVLGDFRTVYAVEPDEINYACLVHNVIANGVDGVVLPDRVALGDQTGELTLRRARSGTHHPVVAPSAVAEEERMVVPCLTLDDWVARRGVDLQRVTFIKSDTQGWDLKVLAGADGVLAHRHIAWQIEFSPAMLARAGTSTSDAFARIASHFSRFIDLRGDTGVRARPTSELAEALAGVGAGDRRYTNLLLYNTAVA